MPQRPLAITADRILSGIFRDGVTDCWHWSGAHNGVGYGVLSSNKRNYLVHRVAFEIFNNTKIRAGLFALHKCDTPSCVNPSHIFLGTPKDNTHDMMAKGRTEILGRIGENNHRSSLTDEAVKAIRESDETSRSLAKRFNVSEATVSRVRKRHLWKHLP